MGSDHPWRQPGDSTSDEIFMTEVLWNPAREDESPTIDAAGNRMVMRVGPGGWRPAHVVTLAAATCFTNALLRLANAAGIPILGYIWSSRLRVSIDVRDVPTLTLSPCFIVATDDQASDLRALCARAAESSPVCRLLRGRLLLAPDIQVVGSFENSPDG